MIGMDFGEKGKQFDYVVAINIYYKRCEYLASANCS